MNAYAKILEPRGGDGGSGDSEGELRDRPVECTPEACAELAEVLLAQRRLIA